MIRLSTIGPVSVHVGDYRVPASNDLIVAALLFLTVERGKPVPRRRFAQMFFPNTEGDANAHSGRQLVYRLRKLGVDIIGDSSTITLPESAAAWDVEAMLLRGKASAAELDALQSGYLPDYPRHQSAEFSKWIDDHRDQVTGRLRRLLVSQIQTVRARKEFRELETISRACLALDPFNEEATLAAAESLASVGAKADALHLLDQYLDDIGARSNDLRIAPRMLRERISGYITESEHEVTTLVGRGDELATLISLVEESGAGAARACFIWGPAGIGKTRLLDEACSIAALSGHAVARVRLNRCDACRPFSILRDLGPALLDSPGSIGASPEAVNAVRGLCGRGPSQYSRRPTNEFDTRAVADDVQRRVIELVEAIAEEQPLVVCVEDADKIDDASLQLVAALVGDRRRLCVFVATRRLIHIPDQLTSHLGIALMRLTPLRNEPSLEVVHGLLGQAGRSVDEDFANNAVRLAAGVPLFLNLLVKNYLATEDQAALPSTLSGSLIARLDQLREPAKSVFDAIVVLGAQSTETRLEALTQLPRYELVRALRSLDADGFLRTSDCLVLPSHDLYATAARRYMPSSVARLLHRSAAKVLQEEQAAGVDPLAIASHLEHCGEHSKALVILARSADSYTRLGRPREAISLLSHAKQLAQAAPDACRIDFALLEACHAAGEDQLGLVIAQQLGLLTGQGSIEHQLMAIEMVSGSGNPIVPTKERLEAILSDRTAAQSVRARAAKLLMMVAEDLHDRTLAARCLALIDDMTEPSAETLIPKLIYETVFGSIDAAVCLADRVYEYGSRVSEPAPRFQSKATAGIALWRCGEFDRAICYLKEAHELAKHSKVWSACTAYSSTIAIICWLSGKKHEARAWNDESSESIKLSCAPDRGFQRLGLGVLLALDEGDAASAETFLNSCEQLYPRILSHRMGPEFLAYRIRIQLALGRLPPSDQIADLLEGHRMWRDMHFHDIIADTVIAVLRKAGREAEASALRDDYLFIHRKERHPVPAIFKDLLSA
jgi:DNA-binding SARP family transcriptional activator/tetratricopeptide (TPR) repeat protein